MTAQSRMVQLVESGDDLRVLLRQRMDDLDHNQTQAAQALGIHQSSLSRWMRRGSVPEPANYGVVADYLGVETQVVAGIANRMRTGDEEADIRDAQPSTDRLIELVSRYRRETLEIRLLMMRLLGDVFWEDERERQLANSILLKLATELREFEADVLAFVDA